MGLKHKKAVIFDLDGTLVDSMWMWKSIDVEYLDLSLIHISSEMVNEHEIMQRAYAHANEVVEQANMQALSLIHI